MADTKRVQFDTTSSPLFKNDSLKRTFIYYGDLNYSEVPVEAELFQVPLISTPNPDLEAQIFVNKIQIDFVGIIVSQVIISEGSGRFDGCFGIHVEC